MAFRTWFGSSHSCNFFSKHHWVLSWLQHIMTMIPGYGCCFDKQYICLSDLLCSEQLDLYTCGATTPTASCLPVQRCLMTQQISEPTEFFGRPHIVVVVWRFHCAASCETSGGKMFIITNYSLDNLISTIMTIIITTRYIHYKHHSCGWYGPPKPHAVLGRWFLRRTPQHYVKLFRDAGSEAECSNKDEQWRVVRWTS